LRRTFIPAATASSRARARSRPLEGVAPSQSPSASSHQDAAIAVVSSKDHFPVAVAARLTRLT
jgi:hypothetical protein